MVNFSIQFGYNKILHTATIHRIPATNNSPLQYLVSEISPEIQNSPPVFFCHPEKEMFEFGRHSKLAEKIIKAIKDYCSENDIPFEQGQGVKT
jgi:hypothetical protein